MRVEDTLYCDGCGVEVLGAPLIVASGQYCCQDCADGYRCDCLPEFEVKEAEAAAREQ